MLSEKLFKIIDGSFIGKFVSVKQGIIDKTDPDRIYVENVRSFFNLPTPLAKLLCELAVREQVFKKQVGIVCPNKDCERIIESFDSPNDIPENITCIHCQLKEENQFTFNKDQVKRITFYQLIQLDYVN